jgi:hypothetical protein
MVHRGLKPRFPRCLSNRINPLTNQMTNQQHGRLTQFASVVVDVLAPSVDGLRVEDLGRAVNAGRPGGAPDLGVDVCFVGYRWLMFMVLWTRNLLICLLLSALT